MRAKEPCLTLLFSLPFSSPEPNHHSDHGLVGAPSLSLQVAPTRSLWGVLHPTAQYFCTTPISCSIQSSISPTGFDGISSPVLGLTTWWRLRPGPCTCTASHGFKPGCLQGNIMPESPVDSWRTKYTYLSPFLVNSPRSSHLTMTHYIINISGHG